MKKVLATFLVISFVLCLNACSKDETTSDVMSDKHKTPLLTGDISITKSAKVFLFFRIILRKSQIITAQFEILL